MIEVKEGWDLLKSEQVPVQKCAKCGIHGIHACPGKPLPKPTTEDEARLRAALRSVFGQEDA